MLTGDLSLFGSGQDHRLAQLGYKLSTKTQEEKNDIITFVFRTKSQAKMLRMDEC